MTTPSTPTREAINCTSSELCTFLQALEAGFLPMRSLGISAFAPSKSTLTLSQSFKHAYEMVCFPGSPFSRMSRPLTAADGGDWSTSSLEVFRVKTSAVPASKPGSPARAVDYGTRWRALSMKYDPEWHMWKIARSLWGTGLTLSLGTLPRWGSMLDGALWERVISAPPTTVTVPGFWLPTPVKYDAIPGGPGNHYKGLGWQSRYVGSHSFGTLGDFKNVHTREAGLLLHRPALLTAKPKSKRAVHGLPEYGELNPAWVEYLMGWPAGWSSPEPLPAGSYGDWLADNGEWLRGGEQWAQDPSDDPRSGIGRVIPRATVKRVEALRVARISVLGNGQVPGVAAAAYLHLQELKEPS